jgi:predicted TIM-barrel fold metal-dependent hydrolase
MHAPWAVQEAMLDAAGLARSVAIQLMAYGGDNRALIEMLGESRGRMRAVAELAAAATDTEMERLHAVGVRGLRFYFEPPKPIPGLKVDGAGMADLIALAPRMRALGWVAEISAGCDLIVKCAPELQALGLPIVFEHMAGCTAARGLTDPTVRKVVDLLRTGAFWIKLTVCAMSDHYPDYEDLRPVHDAFVATAPERLLWGSNWPHAMMGERTPDSGHLLDLFDDWVGRDDHLRRTILSENPAKLFDFQSR